MQFDAFKTQNSDFAVLKLKKTGDFDLFLPDWGWHKKIIWINTINWNQMIIRQNADYQIIIQPGWLSVDPQHEIYTYMCIIDLWTTCTIDTILLAHSISNTVRLLIRCYSSVWLLLLPNEYFSMINVLLLIMTFGYVLYHCYINCTLSTNCTTSTKGKNNISWTYTVKSNSFRTKIKPTVRQTKQYVELTPLGSPGLCFCLTPRPLSSSWPD